MIDAHAHLDFEAFDADREAMWARALEAGVEAAVIPGVAPDLKIGHAGIAIE